LAHFIDTADATRHLEVFLTEIGVEHLRQHERISLAPAKRTKRAEIEDIAQPSLARAIDAGIESMSGAWSRYFRVPSRFSFPLRQMNAHLLALAPRETTR
jgi:hypothetical protein